MQKKDIAILIPSLNPRENIIKIVENLKISGFDNIFFVDDGSKEETKKNFKVVEEQFGAKVIVHDVNQGKGASLKDGIRYIKDNTDLIGIVTMDSDGQHLVKDVENVVDAMDEDSIVLGVRDFDIKGVPFRSRFGNKISTFYLKIVSGRFIKDTQTGLRGISKKYFENSLEIEGNRYEYEMNILMNWCKDKNCSIKCVPIETVYDGENVSYFNPIVDSIIIYKEFFKNVISSVICAILDIVLFVLFLNVFKIMNVFWSNITARILSGVFDFGINKFWVFKVRDSAKGKQEFIKYLILFIIQMLINSGLVTLLSLISTHVVIIKIIVNTIIYFTNFFIKKRFIF